MVRVAENKRVQKNPQSLEALHFPDMAPCPWCGSLAKTCRLSSGNWYAMCSNSFCAAIGPTRDFEILAIGAWDLVVQGLTRKTKAALKLIREGKQA